MRGNDNNSIVSSSFRDPSGFLFFKEGKLYRQINKSYKEDYDMLMSSGLYEDLVSNNLLIPHIESNISTDDEECYKIIEPEKIPFISYNYEWSFSQLKDAALTTLKVQKRALKFGMTLKDASAYNIQFYKGKTILIDTLSFRKYREGELWVSYKQFCNHFLAPLTLMSYSDIRLSQLLKIYIDGIPLDLVSTLLPFRTRMNFSFFSHIHLHARMQKKYEDKPFDIRSHNKRLSRSGFKAIIYSLESAVKKLKWKPKETDWGDYYNTTNYSSKAFQCKKDIINQFVDKIKPETVWDLGANTGEFSRIASNKGIHTVSFDIDPAAVEKNYLECRKKKETNLLPLILDLTNPSTGIGWANKERMSFVERGPSDMVFALALIHHLAISNNTPLDRVAEFLSRFCKWLVIEFIPKSDTQVKKLLVTREDVFPDYTQEGFEKAFIEYFDINEAVKIKDSKRTIYLMKTK